MPAKKKASAKMKAAKHKKPAPKAKMQKKKPAMKSEKQVMAKWASEPATERGFMWKWLARKEEAQKKKKAAAHEQSPDPSKRARRSAPQTAHFARFHGPRRKAA